MYDVLTSLLVLAQAEAPAPGGGAGQSYVLMLVLIAVAFYFIILRPQGKERKDREKQLSALGRGDRIVTIGGLHGLVTKLDKSDKTVEVEFAKNTRVTINRTAVASITKRGKEQNDAE